MYCPECNEKMSVESTTNIDEICGLTFRYRRCPDCGLVVETSEEISRVIKKGGGVEERPEPRECEEM